MSRVIAVANQKGGVAKTTTSVNLAASLAVAKQKVMLIDLDPQGNATMGSGIDKAETDLTVGELLVGSAAVEEIAQVPQPANYAVLPANDLVTSAEIALMDFEDRATRLRDGLQSIRDKFDYIIIDCPPSLSILTVNALVAADTVLIPMQCEYYALEGLSALLETIKKIKNSLNKNLQIEGILRTMYDPRNRLAVDVTRQLQKHFANKVYKTSIPRNVRLAEAPSHGLPAVHYDRLSRGARAYSALANELMQNTKNIAALQQAGEAW